VASHFDRGFEHATHFCEIRFSCPHHRTEETLLLCHPGFLQEAETDQNFMEGIVTSDETWVYGYDWEMKCQSLQWRSPESPRLKKAIQVCSKVKVMLIFFWHERDCSL
jgi:hypothetical protein